jgi:hypothetical protein
MAGTVFAGLGVNFQLMLKCSEVPIDFVLSLLLGESKLGLVIAEALSLSVCLSLVFEFRKPGSAEVNCLCHGIGFCIGLKGGEEVSSPRGTGFLKCTACS